LFSQHILVISIECKSSNEGFSFDCCSTLVAHLLGFAHCGADDEQISPAGKSCAQVHLQHEAQHAFTGNMRNLESSRNLGKTLRASVRKKSKKSHCQPRKGIQLCCVSSVQLKTAVLNDVNWRESSLMRLQALQTPNARVMGRVIACGALLV